MERKIATSLLYERNRETFKKAGLIDPFFLIKMPYVPKSRVVTEPVVGIFDSEFRRGEDIYIELTTGDYLPINEDPTLYKLKFNPDYKTDYVLHADENNPKVERYLVPLEELELIDLNPKPLEPEFTLPEREDDDEYQDCHISELTARDRACIDLRIPQSNKKWINDLIKQANKKQ